MLDLEAWDPWIELAPSYLVGPGRHVFPPRNKALSLTIVHVIFVGNGTWDIV